MLTEESRSISIEGFELSVGALCRACWGMVHFVGGTVVKQKKLSQHESWMTAVFSYRSSIVQVEDKLAARARTILSLWQNELAAGICGHSNHQANFLDSFAIVAPGSTHSL